MLTIVAIPAFNDNYMWLLRYKNSAAVIDPGEAQPVLNYLNQEGLQLCAILNTHHHYDHVGGNSLLAERTGAPIYGPRAEMTPGLTNPLNENDVVALPKLNLELKVLEIPGHTLGHIAYYGANSLFCGDTLFACGCGKLFEGTADQMHGSLQKLAALPPDTEVYCGHEYTLNNIQFAKTIEPENTVLLTQEIMARALRSKGRPTLPSVLSIELATNPFLRCTNPFVQRAASTFRGYDVSDPVAVFAAIRELKDRF